MNITNPCKPQADEAFGPLVRSGCREGFDFTLLFEQAIFSIIPSVITIIVSVGHILYLLREGVKTVPGGGWWLRAIKQVSLELHL